jgi:hypothetical protein
MSRRSESDGFAALVVSVFGLARAFDGAGGSLGSVLSQPTGSCNHGRLEARVFALGHLGRQTFLGYTGHVDHWATTGTHSHTLRNLMIPALKFDSANGGVDAMPVAWQRRRVTRLQTQ